MDPCPFVRVVVGSLALKLPISPRPAGAGAGVHPSSTPCYCKVRLNKLPYQTVPAPLTSSEGENPGQTQAGNPAAVFHLSKADLEKIASKGSIFGAARTAQLKVAVYTGRRGSSCGVSSGRLLGKVVLPLDLKGAEGKAAVFHSGWVNVGKNGKKGQAAVQLNLTVRAEPDPRFVFEFAGEPECSPQVLQVQGDMKQPMFTCKFSCRNNSDLHLRTRSMQSEPGSARKWLSFGSDRERPTKERKGWSITIHDLSGSPVAMASMVTPFVASPGSDRVSKSNPGAWLILRPDSGTWKPWGRLEAWRERNGSGSSDGLGYRFEILPDNSLNASVPLTDSVISSSNGGKFAIDLTGSGLGSSKAGSRSASPGCSPRGSGDFNGYGLWNLTGYRGFVMSSTVGGEKRGLKPLVEVGVSQVSCIEDAAAYVALSAAVDLSMDACRFFSCKLRKELTQTGDALLR
ncbi:hypothetical protein LUZ60_010404 [Juncus effusus]|nr:hypothetical protein LUZ60_010404 [Juncus effusus]